MGKHFLWDPIEDNIVKEIDDSGSTIADYTTEPYLYGDLISQHRDGESRFYHFDGYKSTTSLTDSTATATDIASYTAFGDLVKRAGTTVTPFLYLGKHQYYHHPFSNDNSARYRVASSIRGRWLSNDPLPLSINTVNSYTFVGNSPANVSDPSGEQNECNCNPGEGLGPGYPWAIYGPPFATTIFSPADVSGMPYKIDNAIPAFGQTSFDKVLPPTCQCYTCEWLVSGSNQACYEVRCEIKAKFSITLNVRKIRLPDSVMWADASKTTTVKATIENVYGHEQRHITSLYAGYRKVLATLEAVAFSKKCRMTAFECESYRTTLMNTGYDLWKAENNKSDTHGFDGKILDKNYEPQAGTAYPPIGIPTHEGD